MTGAPPIYAAFRPSSRGERRVSEQGVCAYPGRNRRPPRRRLEIEQMTRWMPAHWEIECQYGFVTVREFIQREIQRIAPRYPAWVASKVAHPLGDKRVKPVEHLCLYVQAEVVR